MREYVCVCCVCVCVCVCAPVTRLPVIEHCAGEFAYMCVLCMYVCMYVYVRARVCSCLGVDKHAAHIPAETHGIIRTHITHSASPACLRECVCQTTLLCSNYALHLCVWCVCVVACVYVCMSMFVCVCVRVCM